LLLSALVVKWTDACLCCLSLLLLLLLLLLPIFALQCQGHELQGACDVSWHKTAFLLERWGWMKVMEQRRLIVGWRGREGEADQMQRDFLEGEHEGVWWESDAETVV